MSDLPLFETTEGANIKKLEASYIEYKARYEECRTRSLEKYEKWVIGHTTLCAKVAELETRVVALDHNVDNPVAANVNVTDLMRAVKSLPNPTIIGSTVLAQRNRPSAPSAYGCNPVMLKHYTFVAVVGDNGELEWELIV